MNRPSARTALGATLALTGLAVAFTLAGGGPLGRPATADAATLTRFGDCDAVLRYFREQAPDYLISRASGPGWDVPVGIGRRGTVPRAAAAEDVAAGAEAGPAPAHSATNVQEAGVDEPDLVKTDGRRIVAVAAGRVHLIELAGGRMTRRSTLPEAGARTVFLSGNRLLVLGGRPDQPAKPGRGDPDARGVLSLYDLADLRQPRRVATLTIDGDVLDARLVGTQVRVVTAYTADIDAPSPVYERDGDLAERSRDALRSAVERSTVEDWVPAYTLRDGSGAPVAEGRLVECADLARPDRFSGLDTVAISAFDLGSALQDRRTTGVVAGGQQIYATDASTYVSSTASDDGRSATTSLHKFVTDPAGSSRYRGSGEVPGTLLNSYALSEHEGVLRVASTVSGRRGWAVPTEVTEGVVTTLREQDGALARLGQVGGLGREDNESIHAVRFIEEQAYVVTFRRTDPLYVLDLSDAADPRVAGELKIPGYSGYLHPVGKDRLLGVGQSGSSGVQFSLFDVGDPTAPRRIDTQTYGRGAAAAELDPRAFLYWAPRDLVIAPTSLDQDSAGSGSFTGLVLLRVAPDGLSEAGRLGTAGQDGMAQRSVVVGDRVYALSEQALRGYDLDTHRPTGTLTF